MFIGLLVGAYSSIFVATPILAWWKEREPRYRALAERSMVRAGREMATVGVGAAPVTTMTSGETDDPGVTPTTAASAGSKDAPVIAPRPRQQKGRKRK